MSLYEIGRLCVKIAGRDAGRKCVVVDILDNTFVIVDGDVRRKRVNLKHLEPLNEMLKLKEGASHEEVKKAFEKLGLSVWATNPKKAGERPRRKRKSQQKAAAGEAKSKRKEKAAALAVESKEEKKSPAKTEKKKKE